MKSRPALVVVGTGRVGSALALGWQRRGFRVTVLAHSAASARAARKRRLRLATDADLLAAELCFFAVPDGAVAEAVRNVLPRLGARTALVHCAGALQLADLGRVPSGHACGSFHPLCAVSSPTDTLQGCTVALSADRPALLTVLRALARALGTKTLRVPESRRATYHAAAVLAAGGSVALMAAAVETMRAAGVSERDALPALLALQGSAMRGVEARGLTKSLTGPVVRGDVETVRRHLRAIPSQVASLYVALAQVMTELAELPSAQRRALDQALESVRRPRSRR